MSIEFEELRGRVVLYLLFEPRRDVRFRWHHLFTSKDFNHVSLCFSLNDKQILHINTNHYCTTIQSFDVSIDEYLALYEPHAKIVECVVDYNPVFKTRLRGVITCVSLVKEFLGLRAWGVVTPEQLYNYLNKDK